MSESSFSTHATRKKLAEFIWRYAKLDGDEDKCDLDVDELPDDHFVWRLADLLLKKYYVIVREQY